MTELPSLVTPFDWKGKNYCVFELGGEERLGLEGNTKLGTVGTRDMKEYRDVLPVPLNAPRPLKNVDRNSKRDNTLKWVEKESGVVLPEDSKSPLSRKRIRRLISLWTNTDLQLHRGGPFNVVKTANHAYLHSIGGPET